MVPFLDFCSARVLRIHIDKLSRLITPAHPLLRIPLEYRVEAPWPFAQQQIAYISAYRTPREKVQCVVRCITSIMNLLQMASSRTPAADDLVPVLIFVVIKVSCFFVLAMIFSISMIFRSAGQSAVSDVDHPIRERIHWQRTGGRGSLLVGAIQCGRHVHQNNGLQSLNRKRMSWTLHILDTIIAELYTEGNNLHLLYIVYSEIVDETYNSKRTQCCTNRIVTETRIYILPIYTT